MGERIIASNLFKPLTVFSEFSVCQILGGAQYGTCVLTRSWGMPVRPRPEGGREAPAGSLPLTAGAAALCLICHLCHVCLGLFVQPLILSWLTGSAKASMKL